MLLRIDFASETPIYMQIRNEVILSIAQGRLHPGDHLPTIRALADETGINMMTVSRAYQMLKTEGYVYSDRRLGVVVSQPGETLPPFTAQERGALEVLVSRAKLSGMSLEELCMLCGKYYEEQEELP